MYSGISRTAYMQLNSFVRCSFHWYYRAKRFLLKDSRMLACYNALGPAWRRAAYSHVRTDVSRGAIGLATTYDDDNDYKQLVYNIDDIVDGIAGQAETRWHLRPHANVRWLAAYSLPWHIHLRSRFNISCASVYDVRKLVWLSKPTERECERCSAVL